MEKLTQVIGPQLRLVQGHRPMEVDQRPRPMDEEIEVLYGEVVYAQPDDPNLAVCEMCKSPYGGTRHGMLKSDFGPHTGWKTVEVPCPKCSPQAIKNRKQEEAKKSQEVLMQLFGDAQLPWQARNWEFDTFPSDGDQEARKTVEDFVARHMAGDRDAKRGLFLGGAAGRGKTSLGISALKEVMRQSQQPTLFVMSIELMDRLRATYGSKDHPGAITHDELLTAVCRVPWLVLDDLAVESPTKYVLERLYFIIEKRRSAGLYTIITSNLSTKALEAYWKPEGTPEGAFHPGIRIVERIREYCDGVGVKGRNQREGNW